MEVSLVGLDIPIIEIENYRLIKIIIKNYK
jgi:hypothetical protein